MLDPTSPPRPLSQGPDQCVVCHSPASNKLSGGAVGQGPGHELSLCDNCIKLVLGGAFETLSAKANEMRIERVERLKSLNIHMVRGHGLCGDCYLTGKFFIANKREPNDSEEWYGSGLSQTATWRHHRGDGSWEFVSSS